MLVYVSGMLDFEAQRKELNGKISAFRKKWRAKGIELGAMDRRIAKIEWTPEEIRDNWDAERRYAEVLGQPIGSQLEMFTKADTPDVERENIRWAGIGRMHGLAGRGDASEPPEGCPPECRQAYGDGWQRGQSETQQAFLRAQEKPPGAKVS